MIPRAGRLNLTAVARMLGMTAWMMSLAISWTTGARAQEEWENPDSAFAEGPRSPINYFTSYDLNVSRSSWSQTLSYNHFGQRVSYGADATMNTLQPIRGLETEGKDGSIATRLGIRATNAWLWNVDGLFDMSSNEDPRSSTRRRQNKVQLRTQYSETFFSGLRVSGSAYSELQQEQGLSRKALVADTLARDSTYTSGRRDGISGNLRWAPGPWLEVTGLGTGNWNHLTTKTYQRKFAPVETGGSELVGDSLNTSVTPTGDERYEATALFRGIPRTTVWTSLRSKNGSQTMYAFTRRGLDTLSWVDRSANLRIEHSPMENGSFSLEASVARVFRQYSLQKNFNSLGLTHSGSAGFVLFRPASRMQAGFQLTRVRNERQISQNGEILNRALNLGGARRITSRLWLDGTGNASLYSRRYEIPAADRDDQRLYANVGGSYRVSSACSTAVHFSATRTHAVAIDAQAAAENNVQTSYQMDAMLRLQVSRTFLIHQNYTINANYFIYDFDFQEGRNSLTRIRRIDTFLSDSLFGFAIVRFTHNFLATDRGSYTRSVEDGPRKYGVSQESYLQNVSVTLGVRPFRGLSLNATQSLGNSRNYFYNPSTTSGQNRWNLNMGAQIDHTFSGGLALQGSIQHIGEFTEQDDRSGPLYEVDYWLAGASLMKSF